MVMSTTFSLSLNNQTTINAQSAKVQLSQFKNLNSQYRTVSVVLFSVYNMSLSHIAFALSRPIDENFGTHENIAVSASNKPDVHNNAGREGASHGHGGVYKNSVKIGPWVPEISRKQTDWSQYFAPLAGGVIRGFVRHDLLLRDDIVFTF